MNQSMRKNTLFTLCKALVELLGKEKALADLQLLYKRHPEMFRDESEVEEIIEQVVREPDLIIKNPKAKSDRDFIVVKKNLESQPNKMADIGISRKNGKNIIFHANKQDKRNFNRFLNKAANGEAVHSLHTPSQARMGGNEKSSGANALSSTANGNSTKESAQSQTKSKIRNISKFKKIEKSQTLVEASSAKAAPTRLDHYASKSSDLPKCKEAPSMSANTNSATKLRKCR